MSQEKIDAYKKEKAGRKERIEKQKKRRKIAKIISCLAAVAIVATIVGSIVYNKVGKSDDAAAADASTEAISTEYVDDTAAEASSAE